MITTFVFSLFFYEYIAECSVGTTSWEKREEVHSKECHNVQLSVDIVRLIN